MPAHTPYWLVRVYNADGRLVESSGPFRDESEAQQVALRKKARIDNVGWAYDVVVRQDEQFTTENKSNHTDHPHHMGVCISWEDDKRISSDGV